MKLNMAEVVPLGFDLLAGQKEAKRLGVDRMRSIQGKCGGTGFSPIPEHNNVGLFLKNE